MIKIYSLKSLHILMFCVVSFWCHKINAQIQLPSIISSNMVLQRNTEVTLWGWSKPNTHVILEYSWLSKKDKISTDANGKWKIKVTTTNSKESQTIKIRDKDSEVVLEHVLFGEVWICSGQSNMYQPVKGYTAQPTFGSLKAIAHAKNDKLRLFSVGRNVSKTPQEKIEEYKGWESANPNNVINYSAVAYFFGQQLQEILDVPVGLIHTSWGGSKIEAWMSKQSLGAFKQVDLDTVNMKKGRPHIPTAIYNSMIAPLIPYTIKGALWYQGESSRDNPYAYTKLFPAMVKDWRARWDLGDFPFYYVQIAPYNYRDLEAFSTFKNTAYLRESQFKSLSNISNSGMAVTLDIGDKKRIHPPKKQEVADRLLYIALHKTYGFKGVDFSGPLYRSYEVKDQGIYLKFDYAENGLYAPKGLENFEIAGNDKVFYPAHAKIIHYNQVLVSSKNVPKPVAVRYAWSNWVKGSLFDTNLLPASSFRTEQWDDAKRVGNHF